MANSCKCCYRDFKDCKCDIKTMDSKGWSAVEPMGSQEITHNYLQFDGKTILKIQFDDEYVYLRGREIERLHSITKQYLDVCESVRHKNLMDWDCNHCGEKTNNMQEFCAKCLSEHREEECDC